MIIEALAEHDKMNATINKIQFFMIRNYFILENGKKRKRLLLVRLLEHTPYN
jgi:hypothetical protein